MIEKAGGVPIVAFSAEKPLLELGGGLLLTGGGDIDPPLFGEPLSFNNLAIDREKDELELSLAKWFIRNEKPVFGICRGMQVINVALGGTLWQDLENQLGTLHEDTAHDVLIAPESELHGMFGGRLRVNSFHHQAVKRPADGVIVSARAGDGVIEAIEHNSLPVFGVQWHPEVASDGMPDMTSLFDKFVRGAEK